MDAANKMIREWTMENSHPSVVESINFSRVVMLTIQLRGAANRHLLMDGTSVADGMLTREEFDKRKDAERRSIPALDKALSDALRATGETRQQKKVDDILSSDAAAAVYRQFKIANGDS
jgi:hypothetical protein